MSLQVLSNGALRFMGLGYDENMSLTLCIKLSWKVLQCNLAY